jgi:hypothetical protein
MQLRRVLLPAPAGPVMPTTDPVSKETWIPLKAAGKACEYLKVKPSMQTISFTGSLLESGILEVDRFRRYVQDDGNDDVDQRGQ